MDESNDDRDHDDWARAVMEGYDEVARAYDEWRDPSGEVGLVESLAADLSPGARVLDAGCGAGRVVLETLESDFETVGLDLSAAQLALAKDRLGSAALVRGDVVRLPLAADTFDALCSLHTVIHVPREHHEAVFAEFARVCRPGAPFLFAVGAGAWEGENDDWLDTGASMQWSFHGAERNRGLVEEAGFYVDDERVLGDELGGGEWLFLRGRLLS